MERKIKIDRNGNGRDQDALLCAKNEEKGFSDKLKYVKLRKGYALTTNPDKYKDHVHSVCICG